MKEMFYKIKGQAKVNRLIEITEQEIIEYIVHQLLYKSPDSILRKIKFQKSLRFEPFAEKLNHFLIFGYRVYDNKNQIILHHENKQILKKLQDTLGLSIYLTGYETFLKEMKKIGSGAFAQVYKIIMRDRSTYALKKFNKNLIFRHQKNYKALQNEINIMKQLKHFNLVKFHTCCLDQTSIFIQMKYYNAGSLTHLMRNRKLSHEERQKFLKDMLKGLLQLQCLNIIHRDLKPDNIMIEMQQESINFVIVDFGLATYANKSEHIFFRCGTPGYMSPQIINLKNKNQKFSVSSDMFSLGVIFYQMLTGKALFKGNKATDIINSNRKCKINFQDPLFTKLQYRQKVLIQRMLEKNPEKRIKPLQALNYEYFSLQFHSDIQIPLQQNDLEQKMKKMMNPKLINTFSSLENKSSQISILNDTCLTLQNFIVNSLSGQNLQCNQKEKQCNQKEKQCNQKEKQCNQKEKSKQKSRFSQICSQICKNNNILLIRQRQDVKLQKTQQ